MKNVSSIFTVVYTAYVFQIASPHHTMDNAFVHDDIHHELVSYPLSPKTPMFMQYASGSASGQR
jgi:hypothetical protein